MAISRGVIYMAWGLKAAHEAAESMMSLWAKAPEMEVRVVGDTDALEILKLVGMPEHLVVETITQEELEPFRGAEFLAGRVKPLLYEKAPWDQVLYVDADTRFRAPPEVGFAQLDRWDFLVAETGGRTILQHMVTPKEAQETRAMFGNTKHLLYHNSGMLFWRRNKRVEGLFDLWSEEWLRFQGWDEQMALLRAIARSDALVQTVPFTWNSNMPSQASVVFHQFGKRTAWKYKKPRGRTMTADELRLEARHFERRARKSGLRRTVTGRDLMMAGKKKGRRRAEPTVTGREAARRRKPKRAPMDKAISEEEVQDKEVTA